jgi:hypothetical protein
MGEPMTPRGFSISLLAGTGLLFLSTAAANVVLDPEQVFGTGLYSHSVNINERVARLRQYQQEADGVDGLLFSSSRGTLLDPTLLAKGMGLSHLFSASMSYGMVTDYVPLLEYVIHDKAGRSIKLRHVFLLLDVDFFGRPPWTNSNINSFLPPEISDESAARYWWRYLTAFQYRLWRNVIREDSQRTQAARAAAAAAQARGQVQPTGATGSAATRTTEPVRSPIPFEPEEYRRGWMTIRPDLDRQLALMRRLVALCRDNQIRLTVAVSPLKAWNLDLNGPAEVDALTERLSRITPLWDFNSVPLIAGHDEYWLDNSHFDARAGTMMLTRIFGSDAGRDTGWGQLRGRVERTSLDKGSRLGALPIQPDVGVAPASVAEQPGP